MSLKRTLEMHVRLRTCVLLAGHSTNERETMMCFLKDISNEVTLKKSFHLPFMSQLRDFLPVHTGLREQRGNLVDINCVYGKPVYVPSALNQVGEGRRGDLQLYL